MILTIVLLFLVSTSAGLNITGKHDKRYGDLYSNFRIIFSQLFSLSSPTLLPGSYVEHLTKFIAGEKMSGCTVFSIGDLG